MSGLLLERSNTESPSGEAVQRLQSPTTGGSPSVPPDTADDAHASLRALCVIARLHHVAADPDHLAHQLGWTPRHEASVDDMLLAARRLGLKAKLASTTPERLSLATLPALALVADDDGLRRTVVLAQCDGKRVLFQDPSESIQGGRPVIEPLAAFTHRWSGELILVTSRAALAGDLARFDFSWFVPSLVKYRRLFGEVLVVSLFLQLFALVSPLFFQVVMDKVLVHRGLTTLDVLVIGLSVIVVFESLLTILRTYVFSHTTSRIDVELGARLFRHLLGLPLSYFQARRVGDSVARVRELENIRSFLTGNALTLLLDVAFSVIFIAVMFIYSVPLTLIVLVSLPLYVALSLMVVPILRTRLNEKFARGAENQALLVETVAAIQTVKASALEPAIARRWDDQLAAYLVDDSADVVYEASSVNTSAGTIVNTGIDTVMASASYVLSFGIENLVLTGSGPIAGTGNGSDNVLVGNGASNTLVGSFGNDTLDGGAGNDLLDGSNGNDTYLFGRGSRADTIASYEVRASKLDVLQLGAGIASGDIRLKQEGYDLVVSVFGTADSIRVRNHFVDNAKSGSQIDQIRFSDGTIWTVAAIQAHLSWASPDSSTAQASIQSLPSDGSSPSAGVFAATSRTVSPGRTTAVARKLMLLGDDLLLASLPDDFAPMAAIGPSPAEVALIEARVQGLIDAMASFSAPGADAGFMSTSHRFSAMPIIAAPYVS